MRRRKLGLALLCIVALLAATETLFGWPWSTDMFRQPSIRALEKQPIPPPLGALAVNGEPLMDRNTAGTELSNPVKATPDSIARGRALFDDICIVCHGRDAHGDGPIAKKFVSPPDLTLPMYVQVTDGFIYGTIRDGGANMPSQKAALSPMDRWDVVNYMRSLQK